MSERHPCDDFAEITKTFNAVGVSYRCVPPIDAREFDNPDEAPRAAAMVLQLGSSSVSPALYFGADGRYLGLAWFSPAETMVFTAAEACAECETLLIQGKMVVFGEVKCRHGRIIHGDKIAADNLD